MKTLVHRSLLLLSVLATIFAVFVSPVAADSPAPDSQAAKYEIRFMENMIDHHAMAIMMAEMCLEMAVHPELISTCQDIIVAQTQEIQQMQTWLSDWYGIAYEPMMMMGNMYGHMKMDPVDFEVWFMKNMISHHSKAIKEAEGCLENAYHSELIGVCQNITVTQAQEIDQMQTWLCEWYGLCNYRKTI